MANEELLVLDGLTLNDTTFGLREFNAPPPRQKPEWIGAADSEWQALMRDPPYENREITVTLNIAPQASMNLALDKIGLVRDKCRLASRSVDGIDLVWTPSTSTRSVTFEVLQAEITDMPIDNENGWMLAFAPTIGLRMVAKPYWLGTETLTSTASSSTPFVTMEITGVTGDAPALGRLIVTDTATQSRRHVEWGLEGQYYNAATSLLVDSDDMVTSGFGGVQATTTGAYDPNAAGNNSISGSVGAITALCGTGNLSHVGTFRVKARLQAAATGTVQARLVSQSGDGPLTPNEWVTLRGGSNWEEADLGTIVVPTVLTGTQRWTGQIQGQTTNNIPDTLKLDYLILVPAAEGYGKSRAGVSTQPGVFTAYDSFTGTTAGGALNARAAPLGGTWATSGDATDLAFSDDLSGENLKRSTVSGTAGRFAILGTSTPTDIQIDLSFYFDLVASGTGNMHFGAIARWTDSSNYVRAAFVRPGSGSSATSKTLEIRQVVAGVETVVASVPIPFGPAPVTGAWYALRFVVYANGRAVASILDSTKTTTLYSTEGTSTVLATAGTLASGKSGIYDNNTNTGASNRYYDSFVVYTPAAEPIVLYSGRNMQIRHDTTIRQDSTGTYVGAPPSYRGSRFLVPVGTSRVIAKARRNDIEAAADSTVTDATQIQVGWTQRGLVVPR